MLALAEKMYGSTRKALQVMKRMGEQLKLTNNAVENITGRKLSKKPQSFYLTDLNKIAKQLFSYPMQQLKLLNTV